MRILLLAPQPFFTERGSPIAVRLLASTLAEWGHSIELLTYPTGADPELPNVEILRCRALPGIRSVPIGFSISKVLMDVSFCMTFLGVARRGRYDVIHAVEESVFPALALRWLHRAPVIYDMDSSLAEQLTEGKRMAWLWGPFVRFAERWALRRCTAVLTMCEALAELAREHRDPATVHVLEDVAVVPGSCDDSVEQLRSHAPAGHLIALYVGNLEKYQGIELLIDAVAQAPAELPLTVLVIGGGDEEIARYGAQARELGIGERLRFIGPRPLHQLPALLEQADILLSPRTTGSNTPLKLYFYMQAGKPILATRLRTHTQILTDGMAELVPPDAVSFARGLERLVADRARCDRIARAARETVAEKYSLRAFREKLAAAYTGVASAPADAVR